MDLHVLSTAYGIHLCSKTSLGSPHIQFAHHISSVHRDHLLLQPVTPLLVLYCLLSNMVSSRSLLTVFATLIAVATSQQCYAVDGTALDKTYTPCNPSANHSGCCASTDICMSNGLCMGTTNESIGMIFSRGCTDKEGKDAACQQDLCPGGKFTNI